MKKHSFFYRNGLSIVFFSIFFITLAAQAVTGWKEYNNDLQDEHGKLLTFISYLGSGHFLSSTFENFQSEFLQMALYVILTVWLRQAGSSESKKLDEKEEVDREPKAGKNAPWPVKKGGWILSIYNRSLSISFILLFIISWWFHFYGSWEVYNIEQALHQKHVVTMVAFMSQPTFWFETFQNWQSEFLSIASIVFLTIYLRQKGSPESKPVDAPHTETGK